MKHTSTLSFNSEPLSSKSDKVLRNYIDSKLTYLFAKRIFDFVVSFLFLILIATWLFPILALLVWIDSRGPIFFIQRRVGLGGKSFNCIKFRTMIVNTEANSRQATADDYRITRIGHILRNSSLDELPQFLNVLAGHMSVVGPRPHMHADCVRFSNAVSEYKFRSFVKPGITGLAQVKGFRGPMLDFGSVFHRYQYDAFYVRNCNFWLDMRIIRKTAFQSVVFLFTKFGKGKVTQPAFEDVNVNAELS